MPVAVWTGVILTITSWPSPPSPDGLPAGTDKLIHFSMYAVLGLLVGRAMRARGGARLLVTVAVLSACAAADEWHQSWIPTRSSDVRDWVADTMGATVGIVAATRRARPALSST